MKEAKMILTWGFTPTGRVSTKEWTIYQTPYIGRACMNRYHKNEQCMRKYMKKHRPNVKILELDESFDQAVSQMRGEK